MQLRSLPKLHLNCRHKQLDLFVPQVMGILNVTPDSFSDGGHYVQLDAALKRSAQIVAEGGSIIDIGGESTRPNAATVSMEQELDRVVPIVAAIRQRFDVVISIDTSSPEVMCAAVDAGADMYLAKPVSFEQVTVAIWKSIATVVRFVVFRRIFTR